MMQHVDPIKICEDLPSRIDYLQFFLEFELSVDGPLIHATKSVLAPLFNTIVDAVYDYLLKYDIIATTFAPAQTKEASIETI